MNDTITTASNEEGKFSVSALGQTKPGVKSTIREFGKNDRIFVYNRSNLPTPAGVPTQDFGDITIPVRKENGDVEQLIIPKTFIPIELTVLFSVKELRTEHRIQQLLNVGALELVDAETALSIIKSPAGQSEHARMRQWYSGARTDESAKLRKGSPMHPEDVNPEGSLARGTNDILEMALNLIENVQNGKIKEEQGITTLRGVCELYKNDDIQRLIDNPGIVLPSIRTCLQNILTQRGQGGVY